MAMICKKCGGIIPDIMMNGEDRNDCNNHSKGEVNIKSLNLINNENEKSKT